MCEVTILSYFGDSLDIHTWVSRTNQTKYDVAVY